MSKVVGRTEALIELSSSSSPDAVGFWLGLWHGLISPITVIVSLFTPTVSLCEVANNGNWYDFRFIIGVSPAFSGTAGSGAKARNRRRHKVDPSSRR